MKFHETHRQDILACISDKGLVNEHFYFSKRKGRIIIQHQVSKHSFSYFQKKDFDIDMNTKKRIDLSYFEVKTDISDIEKCKDWNEVLKRYNEWLKTL